MVNKICGSDKYSRLLPNLICAATFFSMFTNIVHYITEYLIYFSILLNKVSDNLDILGRNQ